MSKSIEEIAQIAAEWWGVVVASTKFDNGDSSITVFFTRSLSEELVKPVPNESRAKLISHLVGDIVVYLSNGDSKTCMTLDVDYHPDSILSDYTSGLEIEEES